MRTYSSKAGACQSSDHPGFALTCAKEMSGPAALPHGAHDAPPKSSLMQTFLSLTTVTGVTILGIGTLAVCVTCGDFLAISTLRAHLVYGYEFTVTEIARLPRTQSATRARPHLLYEV